MPEKLSAVECTSKNQPLEFKAEIIHYDTNEDSNSPVLATSGDNINLIFKIPKGSFKKMALAVINHLEHDHDFKKAEQTTPEKNRSCNECKKSCEISSKSNLNNSRNKTTEDEVVNGSGGFSVFENSIDEGASPQINIESHEDFESSTNEMVASNKSYCNSSIRSMSGCNGYENGKANGNESEIHLKEPSNDFQNALETWRRLSSSSTQGFPKNQDIIASPDTRFSKNSLEKSAKDERRYIGETNINTSNRDCKENISSNENIEDIANEINLSTHSLHTSTEDCPESNTWPEISPFTETEEIPVKELKSSESNGVWTKYFKLDFSNEFVLIKVTSGTSIKVNAIKYKENKDSTVELEQCSEETNSLNKSKVIGQTSENSLIVESSEESKIEKASASPKLSLDECDQQEENVSSELGNKMSAYAIGPIENTASKYTVTNETHKNESLQHQNLETELKEPDLTSTKTLNDSLNYTTRTLSENLDLTKSSLTMNTSSENIHESNLNESANIKSQLEKLSSASEILHSSVEAESKQDISNLNISITSTEKMNSTVNDSLNTTSEIEVISDEEIEDIPVNGSNEKLHLEDSKENFQNPENFEVTSSDEVGIVDKTSNENCDSNEKTNRESPVSNTEELECTSEVKCDSIPSEINLINDSLNEVKLTEISKLSVESVSKDHDSENENSLNDGNISTDENEQMESDSSYCDQDRTTSPSETFPLSDKIVSDESNECNKLKILEANLSRTHYSSASSETSNNEICDMKQNESCENNSVTNYISTDRGEIPSKSPEENEAEKDCSLRETLAENSNLSLSEKSNDFIEKISNIAINDAKDAPNKLSELDDENGSRRETAEDFNLTVSENTSEIDFIEEKLSNDISIQDGEKCLEMDETNLDSDINTDEEKLDDFNNGVMDNEQFNETCTTEPTGSSAEKVELTSEVQSTKNEIAADIEQKPALNVTFEANFNESLVAENESFNESKFSEKSFKGNVEKENLNVSNDIEVKSTENSFASSGDSVMDMTEVNSENFSERSDVESDVISISESDDSKDSEKRSKLQRDTHDEVDCAPTRVRRRKVVSALSKDVIPEHTEVTTARSLKVRADSSKNLGRKSPIPIARSLRSKSLDPSPQDSPSKHAESDRSRKTRAKTPDVISKKDIKIPMRASPRKFTRSHAVESTSSNSQAAKSTTVTDNRSKAKTDLDSSLASSKRTTKKRGTRN